MQLAKTWFNMAIGISVTWLIAHPALAQTESARTETSPAVQLIQQLSEHIDGGNWKEVSDCMTPEAWDKWCESLVVECLSIARIDEDLEFAMPGMADAQEQIQQALAKHGLESLEIDHPGFEFRTQPADEFHGEDEEVELSRRSTSKAQTEKILQALDAKQDRLATIADLWQARLKSPLGINVFAGKIKKEESDNDLVTLTIEPRVDFVDNAEPGVMIQVAVPPVVIDIRKEGDRWKYTGTNIEKTAEAMKHFQPGAGEASDFSDFE